MGDKLKYRALREEHILRVFGNEVLRGISEPRTEKVTGRWRMEK
jgi:hypothetical protein